MHLLICAAFNMGYKGNSWLSLRQQGLLLQVSLSVTIELTRSLHGLLLKIGRVDAADAVSLRVELIEEDLDILVELPLQLLELLRHLLGGKVAGGQQASVDARHRGTLSDVDRGCGFHRLDQTFAFCPELAIKRVVCGAGVGVHGGRAT